MERWRRVAMEQTLALDPDKVEREKLSQVAGQELDQRIFIFEVYREQNKVANALDPLGVHQQTDSAEFVSRHRPVPSQNKVANAPDLRGEEVVLNNLCLAITGHSGRCALRQEDRANQTRVVPISHALRAP
nr:hypothetical protein Iba_chr13dCG4900 [Ipomoea batatas]